MITFDYTAKDLGTGQIVKSDVQAESEQAAVKLLQTQNLFPISLVNKEEKSSLFGGGNGVKTKDRIIFTRQLATLINAGLPLTQSLRTVRDQISNKKLNSIIGNIVASIEAGKSLSASFADHPKVFNTIYVSLVQAGEASGSLDKTLERVASQQEKDAAIVGKIRSAMIYPVIVLGVIMLVMVFMLTTVLPQISNLFKDLHKPLPLLSRILVSMSSFLIHDWWLALLIVAGLGFTSFKFFASSVGKSFADRAKLNLPIFGILFRKVYMARFSRTLGTMMSSGIPLLQALEIVGQGINNQYVAATIERSIGLVKGGKALSATLEGQDTFLSLVPQMIKIGEQSGAIDQMLDRVATYYENEVDEAVKNLSTTIEPLLMVVLGGMVGLVIAAILLPVYGLVGSGIS